MPETILTVRNRFIYMPKKRDKDVLAKVLWFEKRTAFDFCHFDLLHPSREVSHHRRYRSGVFHSKKCQRDIQYESSIELSFISQLETDKRVVFYWEQPVSIPYWRGRRKGTYTPDFGIFLDSGFFVLTEIKSLGDMLDYRVQRKTEALLEFCARRGFGLLLTDGHHIPKDLMKGRANRKLERALRSALEINPIHEAKCRQIMERCQASTQQLHKAVIRLGLRFRSFPIKLQAKNDNLIFHAVFFKGKSYDQYTIEILPSLLRSTPSR